MKRRKANCLLGAGLFASSASLLPRPGNAQQTAPLRVGVVSFQTTASPIYVAFLERMAELGYEQGSNFFFEFVQAPDWAGYAAGFQVLVDRGVDILVASGPEISLSSALAVAGEIPVLMIAVDYHPIDKGYLRSLSKPGGKLTGLFFQQLVLTRKRLQLLQEALPGLRATTIFWDQISADQWQEAQATGDDLGMAVNGIELRDPPYDFERAFADVPARYRGALLVLASPLFTVPERRRLPDFALENQLPTMFFTRSYVDVGGLMSYGPSFAGMFRRAAEYVDLIARGANPAEMPIEQPTKFELVINLQTASALGLDIPQSLILRADEVIE